MTETPKAAAVPEGDIQEMYIKALHEIRRKNVLISCMGKHIKAQEIALENARSCLAAEGRQLRKTAAAVKEALKEMENAKL